MFRHNQRLNEAFLIHGNVQVHFKDAVVWVCELTNDYLIAEYGDNIHRLTIKVDSVIRKTSDNTYVITESSLLLAMAKKTLIRLDGALKENEPLEPNGVPVLITAHKQGGFVVTLDNGCTVYLNPR